MKFNELPDSVQSEAARLLSALIKDRLDFDKENRTDKASVFAETVRNAFEELYSLRSST